MVKDAQSLSWERTVIIDDYPIMRYPRNLETVKTYEGTENIHTLVIGERVTGLAAYNRSPSNYVSLSCSGRI